MLWDETWVFYSGWFLFAWLLLVYGIRSAQFYISGNSLYNPAPYHNELTDFFLYLFAFLAAIPMLSRPLKGRSEKELLLIYNRIYLVLTVFSVLVILSGLGAVFSEVRLSKLFTGHGTDFHAGNRKSGALRCQHRVVHVSGKRLFDECRHRAARCCAFDLG